MRSDLKRPVGRSDLAWLLSLKDDELRDNAVASLLGYAETDTDEADSEESKKGSLSDSESSGSARVEFQFKIVEKEKKKSALGFWRVVSAEYKDDVDNEVPQWRKEATPLTKARLRAARRDARMERPFPYLTPWVRLWPFLRKLLSHEVEGGSMDVDRLVRDVADLKPIRKMPRKKVKRWARSIHLLKDLSEAMTPFFNDMDMLVENLSRICGRHRLKTIVLPNGMDGLGFEPERKDDLFRYQITEPNTTVLALSHLGAGEAGHLSARCRSIAERAVKNGGNACAWVPMPQDRWPCDLATHWKAVHWDLGVKPQVAKLRSMDDAMTTDVTPDVSKADAFLGLCSPLVRLEPELVRYIRGLLPYTDTDAGMERDIYVRQLVPTTKRALFTDSSMEVRKELVKLIHWYHQNLPDICNEELSIVKGMDEDLADFIEQEDTELNAQLERMTADIVAALQGEFAQYGFTKSEFLSYFKRREQRMPDAAYRDEREAAIWVLNHLDEEGNLDVGDSPADIPWDKLRWLVKDGEPRDYTLVQSGNRLAVKNSFVENGSYIGEIRATRKSVAIKPVNKPGNERSIQWNLDEPGPPVLSNEYGSVAYDIDTSLTGLRIEQFKKPYWAQEIGMDASGLFMRLTDSKRYFWLHPGRYNRESAPWALYNVTNGVWIKESVYLNYINSGVLSPMWKNDLREDQYGLYQDVQIHRVNQRFRWIPPGKFLMGSPEDEPERNYVETQHEVELTKGFWLADTACTQELWQAVMGENPSHFEGRELPVEQVSWDDCQSFFDKVNEEMPELNLRFPTEAEWEYACRAGTTTPFSFGENISTDQANYAGNNPYNNADKGEYRQKTISVKENGFVPNDWGLYQMHGNVFEWCADWYGQYPEGSVVDPIGSDKGGYRVLRGGSWSNSGRWCRSANRFRVHSGDRIRVLGFRLSRGQAEPGEGVVHTEEERSGTGVAPRKESLLYRMVKGFRNKK